MKLFRLTLSVPLIASVLCGLPMVAQQAHEQAADAADPGVSPRRDDATIYLGFPIDRLKTSLPSLEGIKYDGNQERLPLILINVAGAIDRILPKLPDLVSRENVFHFQSKWDPSAAGGIAASQPWSRSFTYLLRRERNADGSTTITESRLNSKGKPVKEEHSFTAMRSFGFAYQWLFFTSSNQQQFRFRYLGQQKKSRHQTFVVAFAQDPKKVDDPALFMADGKTTPFYYQGILWIDQSSFEIVALRSDLLAPLPAAHLRQLTTELELRSVTIPGYGTTFWLPSEVAVSSDQGLGPSAETHRYSNYHLFHTNAKILTTPAVPSEY